MKLKTLRICITLITVTLLSMLSFTSSAQVKDINPNVKWKFVRSDSLPILEGATYQFRVPAEKGFDYILTFTHGAADQKISMTVYDLQGTEVAHYENQGLEGTSDLHFDVTHNATYIIKIRIGETTAEDAESYETLLSLLRREKV